jgi:beta-galactosidase
MIDVKVSRVESLRAGYHETAGPYGISRWLEHIESPLTPRSATAQNHGIWYQNERCDYLACWPDALLLKDVLVARCHEVGLRTYDLPDGLRLRQCGQIMFAINYENAPVDLADHVSGAEELDYVIGGQHLKAADVAAWRVRDQQDLQVRT